MKIFIQKSIIIILLFSFLFIPIDVHAVTSNNLTENQQAIINIANAYYSQGVGIQYDQQRRFLNVKPEEAKDRWPIYLDCSSFVYNIYRQAFDVKLQKLDDPDTYLNKTIKQIDEAKDECLTSNKNIIKKSVGKNCYIPCYVDDISKISHNELKNISQLLQVGDLIVYRRSSKDSSSADTASGHVMLYLGNGQLIHCTGIRYNYSEFKETREDAGIKKTTLNESLLNPSSTSSYLLGRKIERFAILRPLNATYLKDVTLTEYAKVKNTMPNLDIVMRSSPYNLKTVNPGSKITYTLVFKNKGTKTLTDILINTKISDYLTVDTNSIVTKRTKTVNGKTTAESVITNTVNVKDNVLSSKLNSLTPGTTIKITYTAKVSSNESDLGKVIEAQAQIGKKIDNQKLFEGTNTIKLTIGKTLKLAQRDAIVTQAKKFVNKSYSGKTRNLIDEIYKKALNVDLKLGNTTIQKMFENIFTTNTEGKLILNSKDTKTRRMLVKHLYGYRYSINSGSRYLSTDNLIPGDVIIYAYKDGKETKYAIYLYLSETELMTISNEKVVIRNNVQERLDKLVGYEKFAVLRPSLDI